MSGGDGVFHQIESEIDGHVRGTGKTDRRFIRPAIQNSRAVLKRRSGRGQAEGELIKF
jgi:hypothetical protein